MFIGHTRFSLFVPGSGSWQVSRGGHFSSEGEYRDHLFADDRLEPRAHIFLDWSLPQLAEASRGKDLVHVVSYSDSLPSRYQALLEDAGAKYPFVMLDKVSDDGKQLPRHRLAKERATPGEELVFTEYRLDDDDLLSVNYFQQLESYLRPEFVGMFVSFGAGISAIYEDGRYIDARSHSMPMNSMGLAKLCKVDTQGKVVTPGKTGSHTKTDQFAPVILDSRQFTYLQTRHENQDTNVRRYSDRSVDEARAHLRQRNKELKPVADTSAVKAGFPCVADIMDFAPA